jgi:hypothetical protein
MAFKNFRYNNLTTGNGNQINYKPVGIIGTPIEEAGHREDIVVRVGGGKVDIRCYVNNQNTNPAFVGFATRGAYLNITPEMFEALVAMAPKVREALNGTGIITTGNGKEIPQAPSLDTL